MACNESTYYNDDEEADEEFNPDNFPGKDYGFEFETDEMWDSREDLVDWVKKRGKDLMMVLVIRRCNLRAVSITCDRFDEYRSGKKIVNEKDRKKAIIALRNSNSKKCGCTFEVYSCRQGLNMPVGGDQKWVLSVRNAQHTHNLPTSFMEHAYMGRMSAEEQLVAGRLSERFVPPCQIVADLKVLFSDNVTSRKQVSNYIEKTQYKDRGEMIVTQWTLNFMKNHNYEVHPLRKKSSSEIDILFFAYPNSLRMLKLFPYMIVIDATYKTNRYDMPLVEIVGFTCTNKTFNIAYAFTREEEVLHYVYIMKKLLYLCKEAGVMPMAIMADRDQSFIKAIRGVFRGHNVKHLLCWVHINRNIEAYSSPILRDTKSVEDFCAQCWGLFLSTTEESFEQRLEALRKSWKSDLVGYVENQWLNLYKVDIVRAWADHHLHFFTRTSNMYWTIIY